jgi:hypothetical protein
MTASTKNPRTSTSELNADESGQPVPVPVPASDGKSADEIGATPKRRLSVAQRVAKATALAGKILSYRGKEAKIQLQIAAALLAAEPLFIGEDGKPSTLPFPSKGMSGEDIVSDLTFYDWTDQSCRLNYSSTRQYLQAARFADAHPAAVASGKVDGIKHAAVLEAAEKRNPDAVSAILADLAPGATIATVEAAIEKHAPKAAKAAKKQDTSKVQTALELAARDLYWPLLSQTCSGMEAAQIVAVQDLVAAVAAMATDPSVGKGSAVFALAIGQLSREWNEQQEAAREQRETAAARRQARKQ